MTIIDTTLVSRPREATPLDSAPDVPPAALFVPLCGLASGIFVGLLGFGLIWVMLWLFLFGPGVAVLLLAWAAYKDALL